MPMMIHNEKRDVLCDQGESSSKRPLSCSQHCVLLRTSWWSPVYRCRHWVTCATTTGLECTTLVCQVHMLITGPSLCYHGTCRQPTMDNHKDHKLKYTNTKNCWLYSYFSSMEKEAFQWKRKLFELVTLNYYMDGLVQDCSNFSALAMELLQSCTKPSICYSKCQELGHLSLSHCPLGDGAVILKE